MTNSKINGFSSGFHIPPKHICEDVFRHADAVCFDVDSTVIIDEGIDRLAEYCGKSEEVKKLTAEAMKGGVDYRQALAARLNIIQPSLLAVRNYVRDNPPVLSNNIRELVARLQEKNIDVFLVSGGFRTLIAPAARALNIPLENIYANRLKFFSDGEYAGFDHEQPTSRTGGKAEVVRLIKDKFGFGNIVMIGDGATDLEACPPADAFIGYGGNAEREAVRNAASWYIHDFAELITALQ